MSFSLSWNVRISTTSDEVLLEKASVFNYIQLLGAKNFKELCNLGFYLQHAFERREIILKSFFVWLCPLMYFFFKKTGL